MNRLERLLCEYIRRGFVGEKALPPEGGVILVEVFAELSVTRSWHANGPDPISFAEIEAWCRLMRVPLSPRHVRIILAMDKTWCNSFYEKKSRTSNADGTAAPASPPISQHPLTVELLDAMLG